MTFKLKPDATFTATVRIPNGDEPLPLKMTFNRKSRSGLAALIEGARDVNDVDLIMDIAAGWSEVDAPFSRDAVTELLEAYSGAALAIYGRYIEAHARAERKN